MNNVIQKPKRNQSLECIRMIAAMFVVWMHVPFPGDFGNLVNCLARFAVPFFFAVSGYFSYGIMGGKIKKRFVQILKLNVIAIVFCVCIDCLIAVFNGAMLSEKLLYLIPTVEDLAKWFFLHINPFSGHLWYLTAIAFCYGVLWIYCGFFAGKEPDYRMFYIAGFFLFLLRFTVADILAFGEVKLPYYLLRDGLYEGLPLFAMGLFLNQYGQRITENYNLSTGKLLVLFICGILLSLLQWKGLSIQEMPLGAVVQVGSLLLLTARHPNLFDSTKAGSWLVTQFQFLSTWVYILHCGVKDVYISFFQESFISVFTTREDWVYPIVVPFVTIGLCYAGKFVVWFVTKIKRMIAG